MADDITTLVESPKKQLPTGFSYVEDMLPPGQELGQYINFLLCRGVSIRTNHTGAYVSIAEVSERTSESNFSNLGPEIFLSMKESYEMRGRELGYNEKDFFTALMKTRPEVKKSEGRSFYSVGSIRRVPPKTDNGKGKSPDDNDGKGRYVTATKAYGEIGKRLGYPDMKSFVGKVDDLGLLRTQGSIAFMQTEDLDKIPEYKNGSGPENDTGIPEGKILITEIFSQHGEKLGYGTSKGLGASIYHAGITIEGEPGRRYISLDDVSRIPQKAAKKEKAKREEVAKDPKGNEKEGKEKKSHGETTRERKEAPPGRSYISDLFFELGRDLLYESAKGFGAAIHYAGIETQGEPGRKHIGDDDILKIPARGEIEYRRSIERTEKTEPARVPAKTERKEEKTKVTRRSEKEDLARIYMRFNDGSIYLAYDITAVVREEVSAAIDDEFHRICRALKNGSKRKTKKK